MKRSKVTLLAEIKEVKLIFLLRCSIHITNIVEKASGKSESFYS